jgi:2-polyprenyl-3-methyl-5-hydroxy-6-metoxy-1,4-benzoquinol methylase
MARFTKLVESLSETFRRSGARELVYFHCDHFEPWRSMRGRADVSQPNADDIADFLDQTARLEYARRLSLFLKPAYRLAPAGPGVRSADGDGVGFLPLTSKEAAIHDQTLAEIAKSSHELQIHIHHEYYTRNDMYSTQEKYNRDEKLRSFLANKTTKELDESRLRLLLDMTLEDYRRGTGLPFDRWFFVHGMWALNGSDRDVCTIDREIAILLEKGCQGDFTFPAGRMHTDPAHKAPFFCNPFDAAKCYDRAESNPTFAYGSQADGRFFIWASVVKHMFCSIDYYSKEIRAGLEDIERLAKELVATSVFIDGTLYIKTHAHSMNTDYFDHIGRPIYPHFHPGIQALLGVVFEAAADAGLGVNFLSVGDVYDRFVSAKYAGARDIATDENTIRHWETQPLVVNAMSPVERLATFGQLVGQVSASVVGRRLAEFGPTESGAYPYYEDLFARDRLVFPHEVEVATQLAASLPDGAKIHEFGTGFGSMALLLAVAGFDVLAIDADPRRLATAAEIRNVLARQIPWVGGRLSFKQAAIPNVLASLECEGVTAVATDVTSGVTLEGLAPIVQAVGERYASVVFDVERFFARTKDQADIDAVKALFGRCYEIVEPVSDMAGRLFFRARHPSAEPIPTAEPEPDATTRLAGAPGAAGAAPAPVGPTTTAMTPREAGALVDEVGVKLITERIAATGIEGSGAGEYYAKLTQRGVLVQDYDYAIADWILKNLSPSMPILEVGAGVGVLSFLLALAGRRVVALDLEPRRIDLGRAVASELGRRLGRDLEQLTFVTAKFPVSPPPIDPASCAVVITKMVYGCDEAQQTAMLAEIAGYADAIIDADDFCVARYTPEARARFDYLAGKAGLVVRPLEVIPSMRFVRLAARRQTAAEAVGALAEVGL